jgi:hypothetical protein
MENYTQYLSTGIMTPKGNEFLAMLQQTPEGTMVALKPVCDALKISWPRQTVKVSNNPKFSCCHKAMTGKDGKKYQMLCLPIEQVPDWLNSINSRKVAADKAASLLELQKFFQHGLNELVRGRYVSLEMFEKTVASLLAKIEALTEAAYHQDKADALYRSADGKRLAGGKHQKKAKAAHLKLVC